MDHEDRASDAGRRRIEVRHMTTIDCPLCDAPATYRPEAGTLDCASCAVELEVAEDEPRATLAPAA